MSPRDYFRTQVFNRDSNLCVICKAKGQDAHHIMERRLWPDGGYYLDNGATLCAKHHYEAELTILDCDEIRHLANITNILLPPSFLPGTYDKWGNEILPDSTRLKGPLFNDESVQKLLKEANLLHLFSSPRLKYPRTPHLPWSPGLKDPQERLIPSLNTLESSKIVVTAKMDGENTTLYRDHIHARSLDYSPHPSRNLIKAFHASIRNDIPPSFRIVVENLTAAHSIHYSHLQAPWLGISVWDNDTCLSWADTLDYFNLLGIQPVPVLYQGNYSESLLKSLYTPSLNRDELEGYVVRLAGSFLLKDFSTSIAKYVRANHVQTDQHWMSGQVKYNRWESTSL